MIEEGVGVFFILKIFFIIIDFYGGWSIDRDLCNFMLIMGWWF